MESMVYQKDLESTLNEETISVEKRGLSLIGAVFSLTKTAIGVGLLYSPKAIHNCGLYLGSFLLLFAAVTSCLSLHFVGIATEHTKASGFVELCKSLFGRKGEIGVVIVLVFFLLAPLLVYNVLSASWISSFIAYVQGTQAEKLSWYFSPTFISVLFALAVFPLCLMNDLSKLSVTSFIGLGFMCYVVCLVVYDLVVGNGVGEGVRTVHNPGMGIFGSFATIMFAYCSHTSAVNLVSVLRKPQSRIKLVTFTSALVTAFYFIFIVCAYVTLGNLMEKKDDVLSARSSIGYKVGSVAVTLVCIFSYPILMFPARTSVDWLLSLHFDRYAIWRNNQMMRTVTIVLIFMLLIVPVAIFAASQAITVLGFLSAIFGSIIMFLLPSMFMLKIKSKVVLKPWEKFGVYFNLALGVVVLVGGLIGETRSFLSK